MKKTLLHGGTLVTNTGMTQTDVLIDTLGTITEIAPSMHLSNHETETIDATGLLLFPLLIDCHVHFREPGLTHKGTMKSESHSALAGGVGLVCEMPNTLPPTTSTAELSKKCDIAAVADGCMMRFFFGATELTHLVELEKLWTDPSVAMRRLRAHCAGLKLYFDHSTGNQGIDLPFAEQAFKLCAKHKIPVVAHCEDPLINRAAFDRVLGAMTEETISLHSAMRPPEAEAAAIETAISLVQTHGTQLHIAHLSTKQGVDLIRQAKKEGLPVSAEVTPHHLFLTEDDYDTLGTFGKMNPPLRSEEHRKALWEGIADGTIDCIATDHAPHTIEEKKNAPSPLSAPSGVPGVETMLPLLLSVAAGVSPHPRALTNEKLTYSKIVELCFTNPNRIFSLNATPIVKGAKAHIAIIDPIKEWTIYSSDLHAHCGWTPFEHWRVKGKVERVIR
jgi:dihydroorotase